MFLTFEVRQRTRRRLHSFAGPQGAPADGAVNGEEEALGAVPLGGDAYTTANLLLHDAAAGEAAAEAEAAPAGHTLRLTWRSANGTRRAVELRAHSHDLAEEW